MIKGRVYTPTGRMYEMMEMTFEDENPEVLHNRMKIWATKMHNCMLSDEERMERNNGKS